MQRVRRHSSYLRKILDHTLQFCRIVSGNASAHKVVELDCRSECGRPLRHAVGAVANWRWQYWRMVMNRSFVQTNDLIPACSMIDA